MSSRAYGYGDVHVGCLLIDAGEHVVVPFTNRASGRGGIEVRARGTIVWRVRDGALVSACLYQERGEALEAAGVVGVAPLAEKRLSALHGE